MEIQATTQKSTHHVSFESLLLFTNDREINFFLHPHHRYNLGQGVMILFNALKGCLSLWMQIHYHGWMLMEFLQFLYVRYWCHVHPLIFFYWYCALSSSLLYLALCCVDTFAQVLIPIFLLSSPFSHIDSFWHGYMNLCK